MLRELLTVATLCNVIWCMYGSLISFICDVRVEAHPWIWIFACIRKHVRLDVVCVHFFPFLLMQGLDTCASCSHLYVCICTLKTMASELQQRCRVISCWQSCTTNTVMTFENSVTCTAVAEIKEGRQFWLQTGFFFFQSFIYPEAQIWSVVNVCIECLFIHLVPEYRLHPFYHCVDHQPSMPSSQSTTFKL